MVWIVLILDLAGLSLVNNCLLLLISSIIAYSLINQNQISEYLYKEKITIM